jgi:hypothetical protein
MKIDIIFPEDNEKQFIELAEKLDWEGLCFVYRHRKDIREKLSSLNLATKLKLFIGILADPRDIGKANAVADLVIVESTETDQHILEKSAPDIMFGMELLDKKDSLHYRKSGLNQVLCRLANKKKVIFAMPLSMIILAEDKPKILGRIMQNIVLCRKFKASQLVCSFSRHPYEMKPSNDLMSLAVSLGMNPSDAKKAVHAVGEKIKQNLKQKSPDYLGEGIELVKQ